MKKILVYTFKTFPYLKELFFKDIRVFGKLNEDVYNFCNEIANTKPNVILGIAKSTNKYSTIEQYTLNKFNRNKKIVNSDIEKYELEIPDEFRKYFKIRKTGTKSFCNLTMFKIKRFILENKLDIPFVFIHICEKDIELINEWLK